MIRASVIADFKAAIDRKRAAIQRAIMEEVNAGAFAVQAHAKRSITELSQQLPHSISSAIEPLVDEVFSLDKKAKENLQDLSRTLESKTAHAVSAADQMRALMMAQTTVAANTIRTFVRDTI